jgi:hypothetical protein
MAGRPVPGQESSSGAHLVRIGTPTEQHWNTLGCRMPVSITVRIGRDGSSATSGNVAGELMMILERLHPTDIGERLKLPDGSLAQVMTTVERSDAAGITQSAFVMRV